MAKQFRFPLEKVLDYKKNIEDLKAGELNRSRKKKRKEEDKLKYIEDKKEGILIENDSQGNMTINQLNIATDYLLQLNDQLEKGAARVLDADTEVDNKLDNLNEASKNKKAVEKLRERKLSEYKILKKKVERKKTDEIANRSDQIKRKITS